MEGEMRDPVGSFRAATDRSATVLAGVDAVATSRDSTLDPALIGACVAMFLPDMPERGRAAGLVGPAVPVPPDAYAQDRLLGAMGRRP
jgi:hypothetical protein